VQKCPIHSSVAPVYPPSLTNETVIFSGYVISGNVAVDLPYNVSLYGYSSKSVQLDIKLINGYLGFGVGNGNGVAMETLRLYLSARLFNGSFISTGLIGEAPNQIFVFRYYRLAGAEYAPVLAYYSFDVFLYQNSSTIQYRYYRIDTVGFPNAAGVGIFGAFSTATGYTWYTQNVTLFKRYDGNYPTTMTTISQSLPGNTLIFTPIPNASDTSSSEPIPASRHTDCLAYQDSSKFYSAQACPINTGNRINYPLQLSRESFLAFSSRDNNYVVRYTPFPVTVYGFDTNHVTISINGLLMFGDPTAAADYSLNTASRPIPSNDYANGVGPVIHPLQGNLFMLVPNAVYNLSVNSYISTGIIGDAPNSIFVIRYNKLTIQGKQFSNPPILFSFDVLFYENSTNFQIRYYRLDIPLSQIIVTLPSLSVGVQGNEASRYVSVFSQSSNYTAINEALLGNNLTFTSIESATNVVTPPGGDGNINAANRSQVNINLLITIIAILMSLFGFLA